MGRITRAVEHLSVEELDERIRKSESWRHKRRWMVIRHALVSPATAKEIGEHLGVGRQTVSNLVSGYNLRGPEAVEPPKPSYRRNAYLTLEEEREFLAPFEEKAKAGELTTVAQIADALEERLGHLIHRRSMIYRLLERNEWSKKVARPAHVKSSKAEQEEFKKAFHRR